MKTPVLFIIAFLFTCGSFAQVTTSPTMPTQSTSVSITFDATQGTGGLKDYSGDVYAHIGVITDKSTSSSDWKYVVAGWGVNVDKAKMIRTGANQYQLNITPDIRQYFAVPAGEKILKIALVFRSGAMVGTAYLEGKATGGKDILVDVFNDGTLDVSITNPISMMVVAQNTAIPFAASSTLSADLKLYQNNNLIKSLTGTAISNTFNMSATGDYWFKVTATSGSTTVADSVFVNVLGTQVVQTLPAGTKKGINYLNATTARLVLWAPYKSYVQVIGDFNNWLPTASSRMNKDGDYYWLDIPNLTAGKEYLFQYLVDGTLKIADPYTEKIADPDNDKYITADTYPNLPAYPVGKTDGIASVLQTNQSTYNWQVASFKTPAADTMVIYECLVRDFDAKHTFTGVVDHLDYLKDLGVNVLELMPVNEFEGNSSWGYNPSFYFAPDKYYGPKNDLKRLVDECHKRNIAVVSDLVLNHSYGSSPFVKLYFDGSKPTAQNPWYNIQSNFTNPNLQWGYDFNHDSEATRQLVDSICSYWMSQYKIDGFRFDFTKGFSNNIKGSNDTYGSAYDAQRIVNLERMASEIWKRNSGAIVIFEHLADNSEETVLANFGKGILLWGNMSYNYEQGAMGYNDSNNSDLSWGTYTSRGWSKPSLVTYMESHDEERLMYKCLNFGNSTGVFNIKSLPIALKRAALASTFLFPLPGPKMIWQFGEVGYDISIDTNGRLGEKPIHWEYKDDADRKALMQVYANLTYLKKKFPVFSSTTITHSLTSDVKWIKLTSGSDYVLVVGNFGVNNTNATLEFQSTGTWYDYFGMKSYNFAATTQSVALLPGEYRIYSNKNMGTPLYTGITDELLNVNDLVIWPNPVKDYVNVISAGSIENIAIYNVAGSKVKEFRLNNLETVENKLYIGDLKTGLYLLEARNKNGKVEVRKVIKKP